MQILLALFFCHFLADFTSLSDPQMLAAKRLGTPFYPILAHGVMHGMLMGLALLLLHVEPFCCLCLALAQSWAHALIDTAKGRLAARHEALRSPANVSHWMVFGFDQYLHAVCILLMWYFSVPITY